MAKQPSKYLAEIGRKGGAAGRGAAKRRSPEHYRRMVELRLDAMKKQQADRSTTE